MTTVAIGRIPKGTTALVVRRDDVIRVGGHLLTAITGTPGVITAARMETPKGHPILVTPEQIQQVIPCRTI